jgi:hypothetical protein
MEMKAKGDIVTLRNSPIQDVATVKALATIGVVAAVLSMVCQAQGRCIIIIIIIPFNVLSESETM